MKVNRYQLLSKRNKHRRKNKYNKIKWLIDQVSHCLSIYSSMGSLKFSIVIKYSQISNRVSFSLRLTTIKYIMCIEHSIWCTLKIIIIAVQCDTLTTSQIQWFDMNYFYEASIIHTITTRWRIQLRNIHFRLWFRHIENVKLLTLIIQLQYISWHNPAFQHISWMESIFWFDVPLSLVSIALYLHFYYSHYIWMLYMRHLVVIQNTPL